MMSMRALLLPATLAGALLTAMPAGAIAPMKVATTAAAWSMPAGDRLRVWANSPEADLTVDTRGRRGFVNLEATWDNVLAGSFVSTPEGVVVGNSRDGAPITAALTLSAPDLDRWTLRPNLSGAYRFAVVSGTRNAKPGQNTYGTLSRDMAARGTGFAIHLGNAVTNGNPRQAEVFREQLRSLKFPTYVIPGNHEVASGGRKDFQKLFGAMPVTFKIGPDRFIMLDNATGQLETRDENWLMGVLARASEERARRIFVFLHQPLVDIRPGLNQGMRDVKQVRRLLKMFKQHSVDTVFAGHIPMYAQERRQGVRYVTTAGGGENPVVPAESGGYHHWIRVDVSADGAVDIAPVKVGK